MRGPVGRQCVGSAQFRRRRQHGPCRLDGRGVDVAADHGRGGAQFGDTSLGGGEEPSVAARRVEHRDRLRPRSDELGGDHRLDDGVDQVERRVPGTELLASADHGRTLGPTRLPQFDHGSPIQRRKCRDLRAERPDPCTFGLGGGPARPGLEASRPERPNVVRVTTTASGGSASAANGTSRYLDFDRQTWSDLRAATPLTLAQPELDRLRGINERIDLDEVATVYLPLSRLLNLYISATQDLHRVSATFLGTIAPKVPYVIGIAGSVAVGKSTFARILQALLEQWPDHPTVDLITTDGFLYPNHVLEERGIMNRKGFPESLRHQGAAAGAPPDQERLRRGRGAGVQPRRVRHRARRDGSSSAGPTS